MMRQKSSGIHRQNYILLFSATDLRLSKLKKISFLLKGVFLFTLFYTMLSCGSKKVLVYKGEPPMRTTKELINSLEERNLDFDWFATRAKVKIESPEENVGGTVYLRVKKDSIIWMVFKKYSVEATRMLLTPDSLFIIYRLDKKFEKGSIENIENQLQIDISFDDMQKMILSNAIIPDTNSIEVNFEKPYHYRLMGKSGDLSVAYKINAFDLLLEEVIYTDVQKREVHIRYGDYKKLEGKGKIPYLREYIFPLNNSKRAYFKFDFQSIEFEKPERTIFNIPPQYVEIH